MKKNLDENTIEDNKWTLGDLLKLSVPVASVLTSILMILRSCNSPAVANYDYVNIDNSQEYVVTYDPIFGQCVKIVYRDDVYIHWQTGTDGGVLIRPPAGFEKVELDYPVWGGGIFGDLGCTEIEWKDKYLISDIGIDEHTGFYTVKVKP